MKSISVSDELHEWIMDHKNKERSSAEKVIFALIGQKEALIPAKTGYDKLGAVAAGKGAIVVHLANNRTTYVYS